MIKSLKLVVSITISLTAGIIGSLATVNNIPTWYAELSKPFFNPPNWLFGPVWTILYVLMGVSIYLIWTARYKGSKKQAYILFGVQLILNTLWSLIFFGLHSIWGGVVVIFGLLASVIITTRLFWPISKTAAYLLFPYSAWVTFATILNVSVGILN